jgi:hypothetical protein
MMKLAMQVGPAEAKHNRVLNGLAGAVESMLWLQMNSDEKEQIGPLLPRVWAPLRPIGSWRESIAHIPTRLTTQGPIPEPEFSASVSSASIQYAHGPFNWEYRAGWLPEPRHADVLKWFNGGLTSIFFPKRRFLAWLPDDELIAQQWSLAANMVNGSDQLDRDPFTDEAGDMFVLNLLRIEYCRATVALGGVVHAAWATHRNEDGYVWFGRQRQIEEAVKRFEQAGVVQSKELDLDRLCNGLLYFPQF